MMLVCERIHYMRRQSLTSFFCAKPIGRMSTVINKEMVSKWCCVWKNLLHCALTTYLYSCINQEMTELTDEKKGWWRFLLKRLWRQDKLFEIVFTKHVVNKIPITQSWSFVKDGIPYDSQWGASTSTVEKCAIQTSHWPKHETWQRMAREMLLLPSMVQNWRDSTDGKCQVDDKK